MGFEKLLVSYVTTWWWTKNNKLTLKQGQHSKQQTFLGFLSTQDCFGSIKLA